MEILNQILSNENLDNAYKKVKANKGAAGVDKMMTSDLKPYLNENIKNIKEQIRDRKYQPSPVLRVLIPKPNGEVITEVLSPIFDRQFSEYSYGFRPNRYGEMAIIQALEFINSCSKWGVDIDIEKFFDKVHHDKLMRIILKTIDDGDVISLTRKYLTSGIMIDDEYKDSVIGTPQGGPLSPLLSNIMLNVLDKELEKRGHKFVRYADDCLIFVGTEKAANRVMKRITSFIEEELSLSVNVTKSKVRTPEDVKFLGFGFYQSYGEYNYKAKLHEDSTKKFRDKVRVLTKRSWVISLTNRLIKLKQLFRGWYNYIKNVLSKTTCKILDQFTRVRIRMIIWKQWKNIKTRYKALIKLGKNKHKVWEWANTSKSYTRVASSFVLSTTITKERLSKRGFLVIGSLFVK